jgi:4a-hydroxytetrahydrobiopterin dehydratase
MAAYTAAEIRRALKTVPGWRRRGREIRRTFTFAAFGPAFAFVRKVARDAEAHDHHPDIDIRYNEVTLGLCTHAAGGLTEKDFASARRYSALGGGR